jgi:L-aminopeptidase/D-esterase-like protein
MHGLKIGHFSDPEQGTGVSVFLFEYSAAGAYWICGSAPASHELAALDPDNSVARCHGLALAGGSAFGLHTAEGVKLFLREKGIGHPVPRSVVPIVPAAAIYDMAYRADHYPTADNAYQACLEATEDNQQRGRVGAGTGATVGKLVPNMHCMTGGIGRAVLTHQDGLEVLAYVVVNAVGDVRDNNVIMAGACDAQGKFADSEKFLLSGQAELELFPHANTTLAAVFTNATFDKSAAKRIAKMAVAGMARAISPVFTRFDGDTVFCMSLGGRLASELTVGAMAAEAVRLAILDAVRETEIVKDHV